MYVLLTAMIVAAAGAEVPPPWGYDGHRIVCDIAYNYLEEATRERVDELLASDPEERFRDFREACTWADEVRALRVAKYDTFTTAHYVNIERGSPGFDLERDCGATFCVVEAIFEQSAILADSSAPVHARRDALKFVAHSWPTSTSRFTRDTPKIVAQI